jgi:hypothetical protein
MRFFCLCIAILLLSCNNKNSAPDVSGIKADVTIHRFDKDFFSLDTTQVQPSLQKLEEKYPAFFTALLYIFCAGAGYFPPAGHIV